MQTPRFWTRFSENIAGNVVATILLSLASPGAAVAIALWSHVSIESALLIAAGVFLPTASSALLLLTARRAAQQEKAAALVAVPQSAEPPRDKQVRPEVGSVGYVAQLDAEWYREGGIDEVRVRCWFAAHVVDDDAAAFPRKLSCWIGKRLTDGELCELKPHGPAGYADAGRWQHRLYTGRIVPYQGKGRLWLAVQEGMRLEKGLTQPTEGTVFAALAVKLVPEEEDPGSMRLSLSPSGVFRDVGYTFLVWIANWTAGVPKTWRLDDA